MKKHWTKVSKKGFTLIELLTVMSIIFILMGLLIPKLNGYRMKAQKLKVENYARQIYIATAASYGENNGKFIAADIKNNIENLTNIMEDKEKKEVTVSAADDSATVQFTVEGVEHEVFINKDGYKLSNEEGTLEEEKITGIDVDDNSKKII